ncbi:hypothetical protein [Halomonas sp. WWR20]
MPRGHHRIQREDDIDQGDLYQHAPEIGRTTACRILRLDISCLVMAATR